MSSRFLSNIQLRKVGAHGEKKNVELLNTNENRKKIMTIVVVVAVVVVVEVKVIVVVVVVVVVVVAVVVIVIVVFFELPFIHLLYIFFTHFLNFFLGLFYFFLV